MTLQEKTAQLYGVWVGASDEGGEVAPHQHDMEEATDLEALMPSGLGQLTRPFGTVPVDPAVGALSLARTQARIAAANRFDIPAVAHEECLAGFAASIHSLMNQYGLHVLSARDTAMIEAVADLPSIVVSDLFGIHPNSPHAWTQCGLDSWANYLVACQDEEWRSVRAPPSNTGAGRPAPADDA